MEGAGQVTNMADTNGAPQLANLRSRRKSWVDPGYDEENDPIPDENEEGEPVRVRHVLEGLFHINHHEEAGDTEQADIEHYIIDKSFRRRLILLSLSNSKIGIRVHMVRAMVMVIGCLLYVAEATYYDYWDEGLGLSVSNNTDSLWDAELKRLFRFFVFSDKPWILWAPEVVIGVLCLATACFSLYVKITEPSMMALVKVLDVSLTIEFVVGLLYTATLLYPPILRNLFVPSFLLCWPARCDFEAAVIQNASRSLFLSPKAIVLKSSSLAVFLVCFMFTWVCLLHHVELVSQNLHLFDILWFVLVTVSTVGYGDTVPIHFSGKLLVMLFIILGFVVILPQVEELYHAVQIRQKLHNSVSYTDSRRHVILCSSELQPMVLRDFLAEFFSDPKNIDVHCVLLVEKELSPLIQVYLSHPIWSTRITIVIGSPLRRTDLARARVDLALACFLHTPRTAMDPNIADQHTVLSVWSFKAFSPSCKLFVHFLLPETRLHVERVADHVMCEGELKLALMANHIHCPGITTLVTLLLHTFKSEQRKLISPNFKLYGMCSSCEVYDSRVGDSKYFYYFIGKNFLFAAVVAYRKYQVTLLGVRPHGSASILLNPGLHYTLREDDICYYIGFTREEYSKVRENPPSRFRMALWQTCASIALQSLTFAGFTTDQMREAEEKEEGREEGKEDADEEVEEETEHVLSKIHSSPSQSEGGRKGNGGREGGGGGGGKTDVQFRIGPSLHTYTSITGVEEEEEEKEREGGSLAVSTSDEVRRGLKLLRYHSKMDVTSNPVLKVCVVPPGEGEGERELKAGDKERARVKEKENEKKEEVLEMEVEEVEWYPRKGPRALEEGAGAGAGGGRGGGGGGSEYTPRSRGRRLRRSISEFGTAECLAETEDVMNGSRDNAIIYSSKLSLVNLPSNLSTHTMNSISPSISLIHPLSQAIRRIGAWSLHPGRMPQPMESRGSTEVILELNDISEEKELEELEEGKCGGEEEEEESEDEEADSAQPTTETVEKPEILTEAANKMRYVKGPIPFLPYCGCSSDRLHLLPEPRPHHSIRLDGQGSPESGSGRLGEQWLEGAVIVFCDKGSVELYHLLLPLRAHYLHTAALHPVVLLLGNEPSTEFLDLLSFLPMVYYLVGKLDCIDSWIKAGILVSESAIITGGRRSTEEQEHMVDAAHILAAQKIAKAFPHVRIILEVHYRYNMRFLQFTPYNPHIMTDSSMGYRYRGDHLNYLFNPQFAAGQAFCSSMIDTMLYQCYFKPYIIDLVRQLLGCEQADDSAYLWKSEVTDEMLKLQTYDRLLQKEVLAHHCIPLGIYRTIPISTCPEFEKLNSEDTTEGPQKHSRYIRSRLWALGGEELGSHIEELLSREELPQTQSFVLVNPPPKTPLQQGDVLLTLRPHHPPIHPHPHPSHFSPLHPLSLHTSPLPSMSEPVKVGHSDIPSPHSKSPHTISTATHITHSTSHTSPCRSAPHTLPPHTSPRSTPVPPTQIFVTADCH